MEPYYVARPSCICEPWLWRRSGTGKAGHRHWDPREDIAGHNPEKKEFRIEDAGTIGCRRMPVTDPMIGEAVSIECMETRKKLPLR